MEIYANKGGKTEQKKQETIMLCIMCVRHTEERKRMRIVYLLLRIQVAKSLKTTSSHFLDVPVFSHAK